jgi:hypothetical protein
MAITLWLYQVPDSLRVVSISLLLSHIKLLTGYESNGWSYLTYRRPIIAVDAVVDNPLKMDGLTDIILAYSPTNSDTVGFHGNNRFSGTLFCVCSYVCQPRL